MNQQRLTNLGTFRAHALDYLKACPEIQRGTVLMARQLEARGEGIPIELYGFTDTIVWSEYEVILSDIFDHLIASLPKFGLRLYQNLSGGDLREAMRDLGRKPQPSAGISR